MPKIIDLEVLDNFKTRQDTQNDGHFLKRSNVSRDGNDAKIVVDETDSSKDLKVLTPESIYGDVENKIIDLAHIPMSAREYVIPVADQAARFALTKNEAQKGDVVQEQDTGLMFYVIDDNKLDRPEGYKEFSAGTASRLGVEDIGNSYTPIYLDNGEPKVTAATFYNLSQQGETPIWNGTDLDTLKTAGIYGCVGGWSGSSVFLTLLNTPASMSSCGFRLVVHYCGSDSKYPRQVIYAKNGQNFFRTYTYRDEGESVTGGHWGSWTSFSETGHTHVGTDVKLTGYSKASSVAAVAATDTVNTAIGKVEKSLDGKAASSHSHVGTEVKLTGYSKASSAAAVAATDTVNAAIGKVEKALDGKAASSHSHVGTEVKLTGYSKPSSASSVAATDTVNAAIGKVEKSLDGKAASSHTHGGGDITSAVANATTASKLSTTTAGNNGTPVYFSGGTPQAMTKIGGGDTDSTYIPIIIPIQQPSPLQAGMIWIETES